MPYTRISEYKHLTGQEAPVTTITYEYPSAEGDPYYPIPRPENQELFKRYEALADATDGVTFVGRLATYRYYNMDQIVGQALATFRRIDAAKRELPRSRPPLPLSDSAERDRTFPRPLTGTYVNPVLDADFPDPAVILAPDGYYYAYATQTCATASGSTSRSRARPTSSTGSISATRFRKSRAGRSETQDFWAPYVLHDGDRYLMYYSATPDVCHDPERGHCLAVATSTSPAGPFVDMGMPLLLGMGFEYIDPMAFDDPVSGQALALLGLGLPADQGPGAGRRPDVVRAGQRADRPRLAQSGRRAPSRGWSRRPG